MNKFYAMVAGALMVSGTAQAGEYIPYVGFDYASLTPNVSEVMPDNYDMGRVIGGVKLVDLLSVEVYADRSTREKNTFDSIVTRGRTYSFGGDVLLDVYKLNDASILGSVGYSRVFTKLKYNGNSDKDIFNTVRFGVGGELNPTPEWGLRAMFHYSLADGDAYSNSKEFTLGARYYFGYY